MKARLEQSRKKDSDKQNDHILLRPWHSHSAKPLAASFRRAVDLHELQKIFYFCVRAWRVVRAARDFLSSRHLPRMGPSRIESETETPVSNSDPGLAFFLDTAPIRSADMST